MSRLSGILVGAFVLSLLTSLIAACSDSGGDPHRYGSVLAQVVWPGGDSLASRDATLKAPGGPAYWAVPAGVTTIYGFVTASDITTPPSVTLAVNAGDSGTGLIENVPVGANRTLTVQGKDSDGGVVYEGVTVGISIAKGETADAGPVAMAYVGGLGQFVSQTVPAPGATGVDRIAPIRAAFAFPLDEATVNAAAFTLNGTEGAVAGAVSVDPVAGEALFTPASSLALLGTYTARLAGTIANVLGEPLGTDFSWSFTVRDGSWSAPALLEATIPDAVNPRVAFASDGTALAVWSQGGGSASIYSAHYDEATAWSAPELIEAVNDLGSGPRIVLDGNGNGLAVWPQRVSGVFQIWSNRYTAGFGWGTASRRDSASNFAGQPEIAMDAVGNALAVWYQSDGAGGFDIWSAHYTAGSNWGSAELAESTAATAFTTYPIVAANPDGDFFSIWLPGGLNSNWYRAGTGWETEAVFADVSQRSIAFNSQGEGFVVWEICPILCDIIARRYSPSAGWSVDQAL